MERGREGVDCFVGKRLDKSGGTGGRRRIERLAQLLRVRCSAMRGVRITGVSRELGPVMWQAEALASGDALGKKRRCWAKKARPTSIVKTAASRS